MKFVYLNAIAPLSIIFATALPQVHVFLDGHYNGPEQYLNNPPIDCDMLCHLLINM